MRVMWVGAALYAAGLFLMSHATTPLSLDLGAGVLIGFGLSGCSFNLVLSAFSKLLPPERRGMALGAGTAAGSFGQFLFAPFGVAMIDNFGWQSALSVFAAMMLLILPLSFALSTPAKATTADAPASDQQSFKTALAEAFGHRSYVLLVLGFFTCGFQLAFVTGICPPISPIGASRHRPAAGFWRRLACSTSSVRSVSAGYRTYFRSVTSCR